MKIQKYHLWLLFFFAIFGFTFSMIVWTVKSAVNTPVYEDRSFMTSYHDVDDNFNQMIAENQKFNSKYKTKVTINNRIVGMEVSDIIYGQRSLKKKSKNQEMLVLGDNSISVTIIDKKSNTSIQDANISFQITRAIEDMHDINLNGYSSSAKIDIKGNWNIIGKIVIGNDTGYLYIKTSTKS
ncbi:Putative lipoprotein [hydrothermal vent metagenome]|uniref:Putative lipoprotein n=1 Tax=hydrothermal vent metagenome TaxID=652676 RepID=A0A1W1BPB9_9ZZZZ